MKRKRNNNEYGDLVPVYTETNIQRIYAEMGLEGVFRKKAAEFFLRANQEDWKSALYASRVVGNYERGATLGLADETGKSVDTIEDRAHAYMMFERLCNFSQHPDVRRFVFAARREPYIYISHFRVLYDEQKDRGLTDVQCLDLLRDIVQAEGDLSSRKLQDHIISKYGDLKNWDYYTQQAMKDMSKALGHPKLPKHIRKKIEEFYDFLGKNS